MKKLLIIFIAAVVAGSAYAAYNSYKKKDQPLGLQIPTTVAVYSDSLQSRISSAATSLTLVRGTDKSGDALSGRFSAVIDEGTSSEEFMIVTCTGTSCTINLRGLDPVNPNTEVTALKFEHRRGASFKVTDYPQLAIVSRILNGDNSIPNILYYDSITTTLGTTSQAALATKGYVDTVGAGGFTAANVAANYGLFVVGSSPDTVGIKANPGSGLATSTPLGLFIKYGYGLTVNAENQLIVATSTAHFRFIKSTTTSAIIGSGNPTWPHGSTGLFIAGNATSTGSFNVSELCFASTACTTHPAGWQLLASSTLSASTDTINLASFDARAELMITIFVEDYTSDAQLGLTVNGDTGVNYGFGESIGGGTQTNVSGTNSIRPFSDVSSVDEQYYNIMVHNRAGSRKIFVIDGSGGDTTGTNAPSLFQASGVWNNTSQQITQITVTTTQQFTAGTRVQIYGSPD